MSEDDRPVALGEVLDGLCGPGRALLLKKFKVNSCIASTNVARQVLRRFNYPSYPVPIKVAAFNAKGAEFARSGHPEWARTGKDGAWGVGIGYGHGDGDGWDGHLALVVDDSYFLDLTIDQASRPARGIHLHSLYTEMDEQSIEILTAGGTGKYVVFDLSEGGVILYMGDPDNVEYRQSPDWTRNYHHIARELYDVVRRYVDGE